MGTGASREDGLAPGDYPSKYRVSSRFQMRTAGDREGGLAPGLHKSHRDRLQQMHDDGGGMKQRVRAEVAKQVKKQATAEKKAKMKAAQKKATMKAAWQEEYNRALFAKSHGDAQFNAQFHLGDVQIPCHFPPPPPLPLPTRLGCEPSGKSAAESSKSPGPENNLRGEAKAPAIKSQEEKVVAPPAERAIGRKAISVRLPKMVPPATAAKDGEPACAVCLVNRPDTVIVDCGHATLCGACARDVALRGDAVCPSCRVAITHIINFYM
jgi:Zinc finger, C3HC4 type (RING finger)